MQKKILLSLVYSILIFLVFGLGISLIPATISEIIIIVIPILFTIIYCTMTILDKIDKSK
jgi:uncharacterized membrane protein